MPGWTCRGWRGSSAAAGIRRPRASPRRCRIPSSWRDSASLCASSSPDNHVAERSGVLLHRKRAGVTSHDVDAQVRRELPRGSKVGHAGTLDPFATGLLLVLVGRATRAQRFLMGLPKTYRAVARLGWVSDTGDRDGKLKQHPPAYSAVKVGGRRAYELARSGSPAELPARPVQVYRAELLWHEGERAAFEIECSAGTYIRSLITELRDAYCEELERTAIGPFRLEDADPDRLVPVSEALSFLPERHLTEEEAAAVRHGRRVAAAAVEGGPVRLTREGEVLAVGEERGRELQPVVVFAPR